MLTFNSFNNIGGLGGAFLNKLTGVDATSLASAYDIIAKVNAESAESLTKTIGADIKISVSIDVNCD